MNDINTTTVNKDFRQPSTITDAYSEEYMEAQRKLYEEKRASEKRIVYEQLSASDYKGPTKDRGAKMASIVARHRVVI